MVQNISGVILAGGANKRFNGMTKANIVLNGRTIISRILGTIVNVFDEIIIVTNTPEEFKEYSGLKIVGDTFIKAGPLGGIHAGLKSSSKESVFIFAGDMPLIDERLIFRQIEFYYNNGCSMLIPAINQNIEPLHSIYNKSIIRTLEEYLSGDHDHAVREFIKLVNFKYMQLEDSEENRNVFSNINSLPDIAIVENILYRRGEN